MNLFQTQRRYIVRAALGVFAAIYFKNALADPLAGGEALSSSVQAATPIDRTKLLTAQLRLGHNLIDRLARTSHRRINFVVSPASVTTILALLDLGASDDMRNALHRTLGFSNASKKTTADDFMGIRSTISSLSKKTNDGGPLALANMIVFDPSTKPFQLALLGLAAAGADVSVEDLNKPEAVGRINDWIKKRTGGLIPAVLDEAPDDLGLVAINALYFKDRWKTPFDPTETRLQPFNTGNGKPIDVPMMHLPEAKYAFRQNAKFVGVKLSYAADDYKLVVITTNVGTARVSAFAPVVSWLGGEDFALKAGEVAIPKFSSSETTELLESLDSLGLSFARKNPRSFSALSPGALMLSRILQKTELHVNEDGTEAAAATAVTATRSFSPQSEYVKMVVDKPFVFALRDERTGLILLMGYVGRPD
ncbi:serpin family protein [Bradyrhizobium sp. AZCC 2289]|uniref:serpin family protein n=1 Tax=Bradyrhizobium sp. AZCC 2289 TaxID=3117026 RepID=UPI002FF11ACA